MQNMMWLVAIIAFCVIEALTYQIISIWFAFGAVGALIAALLGANLTVQIVIFLIVSAVCIFFTRPVLKKALENKLVKTNLDALIGAEALVIADIDNMSATGQVRVNGSVWTARSANNSIIKSGDTVVVQKIEGVKLIVEKK